MQVKTRSILTIVFVILFLSYYGGATFFTHTHIFKEGRVTHSHPYLPSGHHTHTSMGFQQIDHLTHFTFVADVFSFVFVATEFQYIFGLPISRHPRFTNTPYCQLRAPPAC